MDPMIKYSFHLLIVGDAGTGKTTFVKRHLTGKFQEKYKSTFDLDVQALNFTTDDDGYFQFICYDTAGLEEYPSRRKEYYEFADCAIIMFDVTELDTLENVFSWYEGVRSVCQKIPIVLCGNKVDLKNRQVKENDVTFYKEIMEYFEISAKSGCGIETPLLHLARQLVGNDNLNFVKPPSLAPWNAFFDDDDHIVHEDQNFLVEGGCDDDGGDDK